MSRSKNDPNEVRATETLSPIGWTVGDVAKELNVTARAINMAFRAHGTTFTRLRIENLVGKPLFSTPLEFERRLKSTMFFGVDIEALPIREVAVIAKKFGIKIAGNDRRAIMLQAFRAYELANNPALNRALAIKMAEKANQKAIAASETIKTFIATSAATTTATMQVIQQSCSAVGLAAYEVINQSLVTLEDEEDKI